MMRKDVQFLLGLFLAVICISAKADRPVFGNCVGNGNAFDLAFESGNTSGGAVLFTPSEDITVSSVTLWLNNYNGQNGISPSVAIYSSEDFGGQYQLAEEIASLNTPAPNDGSSAAFNFSAPAETVLEAGQSYWLFAYGFWQGGSGFGASCYWESGGANPHGDAVYDQADYFVNGSLTGQSSGAPAFELNIVPEPGYGALFSIPALFGIGRMLKNRFRGRGK